VPTDGPLAGLPEQLHSSASAPLPVPLFLLLFAAKF
jgi:hypothetical protein